MPAETDPIVELLRILPELAVTSYRAAPHGHALVGQPAGAGRTVAVAPGHAQGGPLGATPLTHRQMDVVLHLATSGRLAMTELAEGLGVSKAAVTEMVERLVAKGLVRRAVSTSDRRVTIVELTAGAQAQADAMVERWRAPLNAAFARFPEVEPATLTGFLAALTEELKGLMSDA